MIAALALAGTAAAYAANTTTVDTTKWVTIPCSTPTTITYGSSTYTVSEATTLTVEDCGCTSSIPAVASAVPGNSTAPNVVNGAAAGKVGAAAGVAAAVAYLL